MTLDPLFTRAWAELVGSLSLMTFNRQEHEPKRVEQAESALEHIRSIAPESSDYVIAQAYYTYYTLKDYDRALQLILRAQEMVPSDARLIVVGSWVQRRQGDYDGRIESLRRAQKLDPKESKWADNLTRALILSHYYDEARSVLESFKIEDYGLSFYDALLRIDEHRDLSRWARDIESLQLEFDATDDYVTLWDTKIASRNFQAAEQLLNLMPGSADDPNLLHPYTTKLRSSITTYHFLGKQEELKSVSSQMRSLIDSRRAPDGSIQYLYTLLDLALVEAVEGNADEATRLVRQWRRLESGDLAGLMLYRSASCAMLAMAAAATEAVECLREAFEEPSYATPFIDPYYPHYDLIRNEPEFVELLAELE